jgi:hypothetical protein
MFAITIDHDADKPTFGKNANAVGIVGPSTVKLTFGQIVNHPQGKKFRMLGDDHDLVYEGVYVETSFSDEFQPLDCFGTPNYGCTIIQYWSGGGWQDI